MGVRIVLSQEERMAHIEDMARVLMQLSWVAQKHFAQSLAQHDLTFAQFLTLAFLVKTQQHCAMNQLAGATFQDAATMTGVVNRLQRLGLVERGRSVHDRRVVLVWPTPRGIALLNAVKATRNQMMAQLFDSFDDQALNQLHEQLETLWQALEAEARNANIGC